MWLASGWRASSAFYFAGALVLLTLAGELSFIKELSRTASAVAEVAEGAGSLASAATHAAANATIAMTSTASSLASSSLSLAREVCCLGVDLLNVTVNRSHGRIVAANYSEVFKWMKDNTAFAEQSVDSDVVLKPGASVSTRLVGCCSRCGGRPLGELEA